MGGWGECDGEEGGMKLRGEEERDEREVERGMSVEEEKEEGRKTEEQVQRVRKLRYMDEESEESERKNMEDKKER